MSLQLLHSPAEIIAQVIIDLGSATDGSLNQSWPIYDNVEPNDPDNCLTVYDTAGTPDGRYMVGGIADLHHGVQVRVRSYDHSPGYAKAMEIRALFEPLLNKQVSLGSSLYLIECINKIGDVLPLGQDVPDSKRRAFTINVVTPITRLI